MVAIKSMISGWLTRGLKTSLSTEKANAYITNIVMGSAIYAGIPFSWRPTRVNAANTTIIPCAKLNTPDALKISTNPSAINE